MSVRVRNAEQSDTPWLLEQLQAFDVFFGSSRSLFPDMATAESIVLGLIANHPFYLAEDDRGPVGFIAGVFAPHVLNPAIQQLTELFWWVAPIARGSRAGTLLLAEFLAFGKANADWIQMTLETDSPVDPRSLTSRGFRAKEVSYLLEVDRG